MEALTVINGVVDPELSAEIGRYAQLSGFRTCSLRETVYRDRCLTGDIMYVDGEGAEFYREIMIQAGKDDNPVIAVPVSLRDKEVFRRYGKDITACMLYPFTYGDFRKTAGNYLNEELLQKRNLSYGRLYVDREQKQIVYKRKEMHPGPCEFEILLFLLEHIGKAVNRREITQILPPRKRESMRNIDTHIKNIRRRLDMQDVIISIRSIGYRIDLKEFYRWIVS